MYQRDFKKYGGKFICTTSVEHDRLTASGVVVDAVIPRCIPDSVFEYIWSGTDKSVIAIGNPDVRKESKIFSWASVPKELENCSRKGHEYLVRFAQNNPDWKVTLVSHVGQLKRLCQRVDFANLTIYETESLEENELYTLMANTGVFCHPARIEPFGMVIVEAQAIGIPTCYTDLVQQKDIGCGIPIPTTDIVMFPSGISLAMIDYREVEKAIFTAHNVGDTMSPVLRSNAERFKTSVVVEQLMKVIGI
jgi:glycosyltransferase involved in cell wall biosynthesis